jgi:hypothetical protein
MKTHYAEEFDDASQFNETAEEHVWHEHRLPPASTFGNVTAVALLAAAFLALVRLSAPASPPTTVFGLTSSKAGIETGTRPNHLAAPQTGDERER